MVHEEACQESTINWTDFPITHPIPFTTILLSCPPSDVLSCRAVCTTWHSWFSSSSTIWSKFLKHMRSVVPNKDSYRIQKLIEESTDGELASMKQSFKLYRSLYEKLITPNEDVQAIVGDMEKLTNVLGPPHIFIKLKVNHPVVTKVVSEVLGRYLGCIVLNKVDVDRKLEVKDLVFGNMHRHNFVYINFENECPKSHEDNESLVLEGEDRLEEALRLSLVQNSNDEVEEDGNLKRKRGSLGDGGEPSKRLKSENLEESVPTPPDAHESIYRYEEQPVSDFPTIKNLLCIDQPVIEKLLIEKCNIDTTLVVPIFDEFLHHPKLLASDNFLVGCDTDGKVAKVEPKTFSQDGSAVLGYIDTPMCIGKRNNLEFWGGKDMKSKWPEFSKQLDRLDSDEFTAKEKNVKSGKLNLPVAVHLPGSSEESGSNSEIGSPSVSTSSVPDLMALLAARGVSVHKN